MDDTPTDDRALVERIDRRIAAAIAARETAIATITALDAEQAALGQHSHHTAYVCGGMFGEHAFGAGHILALLGVHALDWRTVLERLAVVATDGDLLSRLLALCEADPMLEVAGERLAGELDLLHDGRIDPFWLRRPKFGLGQAALAFGIAPHHAAGHRGLYALPPDVLGRGFASVAGTQTDQRFGAMLVPVIEAGAERLARIGVVALHRDAEARYHADCAAFAAHQRAHPDRRWRWKPPLSRQGHLAATTARTLGIDQPADRTRGHAANWLGDHDANLRFAKREG